MQFTDGSHIWGLYNKLTWFNIFFYKILSTDIFNNHCSLLCCPGKYPVSTLISWKGLLQFSHSSWKLFKILIIFSCVLFCKETYSPESFMNIIIFVSCSGYFSTFSLVCHSSYSMRFFPPILLFLIFRSSVNITLKSSV